MKIFCIPKISKVVVGLESRGGGSSLVRLPSICQHNAELGWPRICLLRLSVCPSVCPSVRPSVCMYVRPSVCLKPKFGRLQPKFDDDAGSAKRPRKVSSAPRSTSSILIVTALLIKKRRIFSVKNVNCHALYKKRSILRGYDGFFIRI